MTYIGIVLTLILIVNFLAWVTLLAKLENIYMHILRSKYGPRTSHGALTQEELETLYETGVWPED
jgi:hypothetical protein